MSRERPPLEPEVRAAAEAACARGLQGIIAFITPRIGLPGDPVADFGWMYAQMKLWEMELERLGKRVEGKALARAIDRVLSDHPPDQVLIVSPRPDE